MSDRTETGPSEKFPANDGPSEMGNVTPQENRRTLDAVLVDEVDGRSLYAIVGFEGTDPGADRPLPPWLKPRRGAR